MWNSKTECQTTERKLKLNGPTRKIETQHKHNIILCVLIRSFNIGISLRLLTGPSIPDLAIAMSVFQTRWLSWWQLAQAQGLTSNHLPGSNGKPSTFSWVRFKDPGDYGLWGTAEKPRDFPPFLLQGHPTDFPHKFLNYHVFLDLW